MYHLKLIYRKGHLLLAEKSSHDLTSIHIVFEAIHLPKYNQILKIDDR